ncbi:MAG TPA: gliding motility-associated C-terminal domain-containing protein [Bacteroidia bacterium]|nr:gliding motility-associated C-terminal domain-containing protein [Bacteroidia bacterium]
MKRILPILFVFSFVIWSVPGIGQTGPCIGSQTLVASPQPTVNGTYFSNTAVTFCYTVTNYAQNGVDWICGIVPTFGPGWDLSTLQPVSAAPSCDMQGNWAWYTSCTSTNSGITFGPGFFYDSPAGATTGMLDGIPGNNFGDNCQTNTWVFCFSIEVADCAVAPDGTDLSVSVTAYGDDLAGSWGQAGCVDPPVTLGATVFCNCTLIVPTVNITNATCASSTNGALTVIPQGVAPYTFAWSNGATTQTISNLAPGIYTVTVTDSTSCTKVVTIPVGSAPAIVLNPTIIPNGCDTSGGSVTLAPSGGLGSTFTFLWSNGSTASSITNLVGGTYTVTVTDSAGCTETDQYLINTAVPVNLSVISNPSLCNGPNGSATALTTGGTGTITYQWSNGQTTATATALVGGTYTVTVTDSLGCFASTVATVVIDNDLVAAAYGDSTICNGTSITIGCGQSGGTAPYTYQWNNGANGSTQLVGPAANTTYGVIITDVNGCTSLDSVTVNVINAPVLSVTPDTTICYGTGTTLGVSGGSTYSWSPAAGLSDPASAAPVATPVTSTMYTVTSANGPCSASATINVNVEPEIIASFAPDSSQGDAPFTVTFNSNSSGFASATWSFGDGSDTTVTTSISVVHTYSQQGSYTVTLTLTNSLGCTDTATFSFIIVNEYSAIFVPSVFTPNGDGLNDDFHLQEDKLESVEVVIFSRWGQEVISWNKLGGSWDGKGSDGTELPDGTYYYIIKATGIDHKQYNFQGTVKLLRTKK